MSTDRSQLEDKEEFGDDFIILLSDTLYKLTEHHFIIKNQSQYLKGLKASLNPNECIIILDFAENFSFVVQEAFHWNNAQATIHLFVVYHKSNNGDLCHRAFACISDHMTHNTVAVYAFVEKLINDYVKLYLPQIQKIHYFSDGPCAQFKNYKNFANLIFMYKILVLQQSGTTLRLLTGRIRVIELEGL